MKKKYELVPDNFIIHKGEKIFRIRALIDFNDVQAGMLGGFVSGEHNLSQNGYCWIYDDAKVIDGAHVTGNCIIANKAVVYENAHLSGEVWICDKAAIHGDSIIRHNSRIYDNAEITGKAVIDGDSCIKGESYIAGNAVIRNSDIFNASITGEANLSNTLINGGEI